MGIDDIDELTKIGFQFISEGKLAVILDFSTFDYRLGLDKLKMKHKPEWPAQVSIIQYYLQKLKSMGKAAVGRCGRNFLTERDPILVLVQCNEYNLEEVDDYFVQNKYFGYQGLICFPIVTQDFMDFQFFFFLNLKFPIGISIFPLKISIFFMV